MTYNRATTKSDMTKIDKLNGLKNINTFYDDVRKITKNVRSNSAIRAWERLSEQRYDELLTGIEDVRTDFEMINGKFVKKYYDNNWNEIRV